MAASSASTFTAATPNINYCYDIFLNHRGPDVKETFARSLYLRLTDEGLRAFLDQEELPAGFYFPTQIEQAIKTAKVHVAIFSPRYAESDWCLRELVMMLESKTPIIPIFYLVTPTDLRWTTKGKYARDLKNWSEKKTEEGKLRYDSKDIENWRVALSLVANYKGFELEVCNGEELQLELLDKLVKCLLETVEKEKKPDLYVAKYPTGLNEKLQDFEKTVLLQQQQTGKPQILGIVGLGGVGKTTLAKEFFNKKKSKYHKSCFLPDVRENAGKGSLNSLQRKLLKSLTSIDVPIGSVDEGKGRLIEYMDGGKRMSKKDLKSFNAPENVLIILDDVDHSDQVDALLPFDLTSGSLILITSRDKRVLRMSKVESKSIYILNGLNDQHSRELFCSHAFSQTYPLPGFESLVGRFLKACNGLPLSLKVVGANLYDRDITDWEEELGSFPTEINDRLKISYKALAPEEKQIFLDVACFFKGLDRDTAIGIWNESGWKGRRGLQNLQDKCLVDVDGSNVIHMHDQVREMGRDVAEKSSTHRLWHWRYNVIDDPQSSGITARGIKMDLSEYNAYGALLRRIDTSMLQILHTEGSVLERILKRAELPSLLWLRWVDCPYSSLPSWIPMKKLRYLELSGSVLNTLWERERGSQVPLQLPVFLELLGINSCVALKSITGLDQLTKLRQLSVNDCSELKELPSIQTLVSLEKLSVKGCVKLKNIQGLARCTQLRSLHVYGCSDLEELPIETLVSLEELRAGGCKKLKNIQGLALCTRLRNLHLHRCSDLEELPSIETLESLEELYADGCVKLKSIQGLARCTRLRNLHLHGCSDLEDLPSIETLVSLVELHADGCVKLKSIQGLAQCTRLRMLHVHGELPSIETLASLEELYAGGCVKLKSIQGLARCTRLQKLVVNECSNLEQLPGIEALLSLEKLIVDRCVKLKSIQGLARCTRLQNLVVHECSNLEQLPSIEALLSLEKLIVGRCVKLKSIQGLARCTRLRILSVWECSELEEVEGVEDCTWLEKLDVSKCPKLQELPSIEKLASLEELNAGGCVKLKSIQGLARCTRLQRLVVQECSNLEELPNIETLVSLEELYTGGCVKLKSIQGLARCTRLRILFIGGCSELEEVEGVEDCTWLEKLDVSVCPKLQCPIPLWE